MSMEAPIVDTVRGIDIWKEGSKYEIYDGMSPLEEYDSLAAARRGARQYADSVSL
jgi:hypothetical protein